MEDASRPERAQDALERGSGGKEQEHMRRTISLS